MISLIEDQDLVQENFIIGALMVDATEASKALEELRPEDFVYRRNAVLFGVMSEMHGKGVHIDLLTLREGLVKRALLEEAGGDDYLRTLAAMVVSGATAEQYLPTVKDHALRRQAVRGLANVLERANDARVDTRTLIGEAEALLLSLAERQVHQGLRVFGAILPATLRQLERMVKGEVTGVPTGLFDLDRITGGLQPTDFVILAGRPAMGKTGLGFSIAWRAAKMHGKKVAFFSLEMSAEQLQQRALCAYRNVDLHRLRTGKVDARELALLDEGVRELRDIPLYIDDASHKTPLQMLSQARRLKRTVGLDMLIMDYCQLGSSDEETENRQQEVASVARGCKAIAKDLHIPVVGLAQLHRGLESRQTKEPMLSDLRESGELEQAADVVGFIHRPHYYDPEQEEALAKLILAKYRNGPTGTIKLNFNKESASFSDYVEPSFMEGEPSRGKSKSFSGHHRAASAPAARHPSDPGPTEPPPRQPRPGEANYD